MMDPANPQDQKKLQAACRQHPRAVEKGLDKVGHVKLNPEGNGFVAVLSNGSEMSFSKKHLKNNNKCVDTTLLHKGYVQEAFRNEVLDQTRDMRISEGYGGRGADMHVSHIGQTEFKALWSNFLNNKNLCMDKVQVKKKKQRSHHLYECWYFTDRDLARDWKDFHKEHAMMTMQTSGENLTRKRQKVVRPGQPA